MSNTPISSSLEDYLEVIANLSRGGGHAHAKEIAEKLKVKMPSVTNALRALSEHKLVTYSPHNPVILTELGQKKADQVCSRHAILQQFFSNILKLDTASASSVACKVEHVVSNTVISRIVQLTGAIQERSDCRELRDFLNSSFGNPEEADPEAIVSLDQLQIGQRAVISEISSELRGRRRFADLGLVPGAVLEFEGCAPFGDLIRIKVLDSSLSLRAGDAMNIWVHPYD